MLYKEGVFKISQNSQENLECQSLFFIKIADISLQLLLKKRLWQRCFLVNFEKYLRAPFLQNTSGQLLLQIH